MTILSLLVKTLAAMAMILVVAAIYTWLAVKIGGIE